MHSREYLRKVGIRKKSRITPKSVNFEVSSYPEHRNDASDKVVATEASKGIRRPTKAIARKASTTITPRSAAGADGVIPASWWCLRVVVIAASLSAVERRVHTTAETRASAACEGVARAEALRIEVSLPNVSEAWERTGHGTRGPGHVVLIFESWRREVTLRKGTTRL